MRLLPRPQHTGTLSFGFATMAAMAAAQVEMARTRLVCEGFGIDRTKVEHSASVNRLMDGVKTLANVARGQGSVLGGVKEAVKVASAGTAFLKDHAFTLHIVTEGRTQGELDAALVRAARDRRAPRRRDREHGAEGDAVEAVRPGARHARPRRRTLGADPCGVSALQGAGGRGRERRLSSPRGARSWQQHGIVYSVMSMTVGAEFFLEPAFYWHDEITPLHAASLGEDVVRPWKDRPANVAARNAVAELRRGTQELYCAPRRRKLAGRARLSVPRGAGAADLAPARSRQIRARSEGPDESGLARARAIAPSERLHSMGYTITEKILARVAGLPAVKAGHEIEARPDFVISYDFPGYTDVFFREAREEFGVERVSSPERFVLFIDHMVPAAAPKEEELHRGTRVGCGPGRARPRAQGHRASGRGELGYATPGAFIVHFDGHVSQLGAFGVYAFGARKGVLEVFVPETLSLTVPPTVKIVLTGTLQLGVMARDVFHHLVRVLGPSSCAFKAVERPARSSMR